MTDNAYLETVARLEKDIHPIDASAGWASIAISLKRIADSLERITTIDGLEPLVKDLHERLGSLD